MMDKWWCMKEELHSQCQSRVVVPVKVPRVTQSAHWGTSAGEQTLAGDEIQQERRRLPASPKIVCCASIEVADLRLRGNFVLPISDAMSISANFSTKERGDGFHQPGSALGHFLAYSNVDLRLVALAASGLVACHIPHAF
ncbi:hypothetical protein DFH94DRAFT_678683 [Russula ochroleuca]|uniref:Uncharacterized protein n=1 Tax=Russula ochroleuca TaxID=152965 RepID=A0A9P5N437_9AGAM|nr:hypothetical protein DFH94DRAFT_678683 [Russula ochroleuca]